MDDLSAVGKIAASAMRAQSHRMRITAENMANADSTGSTPGADPYRRKVLSFESVLDRATGAASVQVKSVSEDPSAFPLRYDPSHPAADAAGVVRMPNIDPMIELANMREASRSYEASLNMMDTGRRMKSQLIEILE